jgi:hypothetical protein
MLNIDPKIFAHNLKLTQEYCRVQCDRPQRDNARVFRSYNPIIKGKALFEFRNTVFEFAIEPSLHSCALSRWTLDPIDHQNLVNQLFKEQISFKERQVLVDAGRTYQGDILISQIDCTVVDGASEVQSLGLVDVYDIPPIDTWFYLIKSKESRLLFAWIPNELRHYANEAVLVNCVDCINWFQSWYPEDYEQLMANAQHGIAESEA